MLRPFFLAGKVLDIGTVVDIADRPLLGGLLSGGKVERIPGEPESAGPGPMTTEDSGLVSGKRKPKGETSDD